MAEEYQTDEIAITNLWLDEQNPRHPKQRGQRNTIKRLLDDDGQKLLALATDLVEHGVSPIDLCLVIARQRHGQYTVLEGNRRVAALKLLVNPSLAQGHQMEPKFRALSKSFSGPSSVMCAVLQSRSSARHWQELRHTGAHAGAGVVRWSSEAQQRFSGGRGTQRARALAFADSLAAAYSDDDDLVSALETVTDTKLTTLGRLVSDPDVRKTLGFDFAKDDSVAVHYPQDALLETFRRVINDLRDHLSVTSLKNKDDRARYARSVASDLPDASQYESEPTILVKTKKPKRPTTRPAPPKKPPADRLLVGLELENMRGRSADLVAEVQQIDISKLPNTAGVLLRVVVDLMVTEALQKNGKKVKQELKARIRDALLLVDPNQNDRAFQGVRTGLQDGTSLMSISTMHGYVHNAKFSPTTGDLKALAANYEPFLQALDTSIP